jgi:hypothetical protein
MNYLDQKQIQFNKHALKTFYCRFKLYLLSIKQLCKFMSQKVFTSVVNKMW